ncbi:MAG: hypothetical protein R2711_02935 [Acidimicrobiales bacterium]
MEKRHLDRRIEQMAAEGTTFRTGVDVGIDVTADDLRAEFDAVARRRRHRRATCRSPGASSAGIHQAMEYLPYA